MSWRSKGASGLLLVSALVAGCSQEPDLRAASIEELLRLTTQARAGEPQDSLSHRALREVLRRPPAAVTANLQALLGSPGTDMRSAAAELLGELLADSETSAMDTTTRSEVEAALLAQLADREERARAGALSGLARAWSAQRPDTVPAAMSATVTELVAADEAGTRFQAAISAFSIGPALAITAPALTTRLEAEPDAGVRFALACALGALGSAHPPAQLALIAAMDDPDEKVRFAATTSLGTLPAVDTAAIDRLRRRLGDTDEAAMVRAAAIDSLAEHARSAEQAAAVLELVLAGRSVYEDFEAPRWLDALGRLAARVPQADAATAACRQLEVAFQGERDDMAAVAASSLARIACARRDSDLGHRVAARLLADLPALLSASQHESAWSSRSVTSEPVLESLVELALWPAMQVDAQALREVLQMLLEHESWWTRGWANEQLGRLR